MVSYPIPTMNIEQATEAQFRLVDTIHRFFTGNEFLNNGDLGVVYSQYPQYTKKVEMVLADFFGGEDCVLVRGAGTGAIRNVLSLMTQAGDSIIVHDAPVYATTKDIMEDRGLTAVKVDFNHLTMEKPEGLENISCAVVQHSRQKMNDSYRMEEVIKTLKELNPYMNIVVDDNYTAMKALKIGVNYKADASCFSLFKLLGKEGIGCVIASKEICEGIRKKNYSGGSKVQGFEAMECLRSMVYAPVALAIASGEVDKVVRHINEGGIKGIESAVRANAQSVTIIAKFEQPIAKKAIEIANKLGAAPYPVGAESKYEVTAMFYRASGTFLSDDPQLEEYVLRINPMRSGAQTIIRILEQILLTCEEV